MSTEQMLKKLKHEIELLNKTNTINPIVKNLIEHYKYMIENSLEVIKALDEENKFLRQNQKEDWF